MHCQTCTALEMDDTGLAKSNCAETTLIMGDDTTDMRGAFEPDNLEKGVARLRYLVPLLAPKQVNAACV